MSSSAPSQTKRVTEVADIDRRVEGPVSEISATAKAILKPLASLRITVVLFVLSLFLILAGTLAQVDYGIWTVMATYFRTWIAWIEIQVFMPNEWAVSLGIMDTVVPFPGGYILGGAMVINLVAAHAVRFKVVGTDMERVMGVIGSVAMLSLLTWAVIASTKVVWPLKAPIQFGVAMWISTIAILALLYPSYLLYAKRTGIVLMHAGIVLLLVNELVTGLGAYEGRMTIPQQGITNFTYNLENSELAFIDTSGPGPDRVVSIPEWMMARSAEDKSMISDERLPFDVKVEIFYKNSSVSPPVRAADLKPGMDPADSGDIRQIVDQGKLVGVYIAREIKVGSGVDGEGVADVGSAYVSLHDKTTGDKLGTYLVSSHFTNSGDHLMDRVAIGDKSYLMGMRFAREYKPYSIYLVEFRHDKFTGTQKARNFSSEVLVVDEDHPQGRPAMIRMNEPLRYRGETFFQSSFLPGDSASILQVVRNPGYMLPYIACIVVSIGMFWHFLGHLKTFYRRLLK